MQEEKWSLGTAGATVRLEAQVGVIDVRGLVCNRVLETLHARIATWAELRKPVGYVLVLGWATVLTASGPREVMAGLRGATRPWAAKMPAAMLVPPERLKWAAKHCQQLSAYGLCRAAFSERDIDLAVPRASGRSLSGFACSADLLASKHARNLAVTHSVASVGQFSQANSDLAATHPTEGRQDDASGT